MWCVFQTLRLVAEGVGWIVIFILAFGLFAKHYFYKEV